ncbi:type II CRISPR RNA-guided endonuclease Cas9 [Malaciobacter mytili]|uniref:type II CRISPR RNA-guided endonuclease Cas9 n=1 Tax=Malaciobacter mytili TaxID=603050 RepID=UPI003BB1CD2B
MSRVLGLDIGTNSIGFCLIEKNTKDNQTFFEEIVSNSIIFSEYIKAEDRRNFRSSRRRNERKSRRNRIIRKLLTNFGFTNSSFIDEPSIYFNKLSQNKNPYILRKQAVEGKNLTKEEFVFSLYTIITRRGYSNEFKTEESNEDGVINSSISKNKEAYIQNNLLIPSQVLMQKKESLEKDAFINVAIRNKKDDYNNSLDRELWKIELEQLLNSQKNNNELFENLKKFELFKEKIFNGVNENSLGIFEQRALKGMEEMVGYCTFYNQYHKNSQRRVSKSHISSIELTLRQRIENSILGNLIINKKTGEFYTPTKEEIDNTVEFWLKRPNVKTINTNNIFEKTGLKNIIIKTSEKQDETVLDITLHKQLVEIFKDINLDIYNKYRELYSSILQKIHYYVNKKQIAKKIKEVDTNNLLTNEIIDKLSSVDKGNKESYASFSLLFIDEILKKIKEGKNYQDSLSELGYFKKYLNMEPYTYLPPLNPSKKDIKYLQKKIKYFQIEHIFYQPLVSPNVKRVISILRRLINDLLVKYGKIDQIIIETARELNSKKEEEKIKETQSKNKKEINEAEKLLKGNNYKLSNKNIQKARLFIEQKAKCLYSGKEITLEEALDENITEIEHFIPRSKIWINSNKNKILVFKKYNQEKGDKNPIFYLKSKNQWENFQHRVKEYLGKNKQDKINWLTNEELINKTIENEKLEDRFLNDTRGATKIISNYLKHYLYPKKNEYGKDETNTDVITVTGRAINELKHLWGVDAVQPKNEDDKKDRETNYHHTIDSIVISLLDNSAKKALNDFFKQNENGFRTKESVEKLKARFPKTSKGLSLVEFIKEKVRKYENDELYICPIIKKRDNIVGFKDGNIKLYFDKNKENFYQLDKKAIDKNLLFDKNGKEISNNEVNKKVEELIYFLDLPKQNNIKEAILKYKDKLLATKEEISILKEQIKNLNDSLPNKKEYIETPETLKIKEQIKLLEKEKQVQIDIQNEPCFFTTKKGLKQIIRNIKVKTKDITKVDSLIITDKNIKNRVRRLDKQTYLELKEKTLPFVAKLNDATLNVDLYNTSKGQIIGLNYFSSIKNNIEPKINEKKRDLILDFKDKITIQKNDLLEVFNLKENTREYYIFNGGGNISGGNNKIEVKSLNIKDKRRLFITLNKEVSVKKIKLDYNGTVFYV